MEVIIYNLNFGLFLTSSCCFCFCSCLSLYQSKLLATFLISVFPFSCSNRLRKGREKVMRMLAPLRRSCDSVVRKSLTAEAWEKVKNCALVSWANWITDLMAFCQMAVNWLRKSARPAFIVSITWSCC